MERILKKRFLMILMSLMLVAGFVPMTASAAPVEKAKSVTVGDVELDADNVDAITDKDGNVELGGGEEDYNVMFSDGTLYLRNATIVAPEEKHGISAEGYITIDISGDNSVTGGGDIKPLYAENYGIYATGNITITSTNNGGGDLTATGGAGSNSGGIYSFGGDVTIEGYVGEINAAGVEAASSSLGIGTESGNVIINGGNVKATGGEVTGETGESDGICASDGDSGENAVGNVYINGGNIEAAGGDAKNTGGHSDGICADNDISIKSTGELIAYGGDADLHSNGICSDSGSITINANVKASGGTVYGDNGHSDGICAAGETAGDIIIDGGNVDAFGGTANNKGHSDGICANNHIRITTTGEITAYGGDADLHSNGICSDSGSIMIDANVTATGGDSGAESIAINVNGENDITIEGGKVYAIGKAASHISAGINAGSVMIQDGDLFAASKIIETARSAAATEKGINGNVVVQPAVDKMIAVETGSDFESGGGSEPNITIYNKTALDGSPFTAESMIGNIEAKVVNIYTGDAPDVMPETDESASGDKTGNNVSDSKNGGTPETGDDFNAVPMVTLMGLAAAVAAGTVAYGVRRKNGAR